VSTCIDLCRALGWLPAEVYLESPQATPAELIRFHDPAYVEALMAAERSQRVSAADRRRFNIGCNGNPVLSWRPSCCATAVPFTTRPAVPTMAARIGPVGSAI
jgi:acetoin utilization deacetylase AcuC-like enzyme